MKRFHVTFTDVEGWTASVDVRAEYTIKAIIDACYQIGSTERGVQLAEIRTVEVEED